MSQRDVMKKVDELLYDAGYDYMIMIVDDKKQVELDWSLVRAKSRFENPVKFLYNMKKFFNSAFKEAMKLEREDGTDTETSTK